MAVLGRNFIISITPASGTKTVVAGQKTGTISVTGDNVETTVKGNGSAAPLAKTYQANMYSWEVQLSGVYDLTSSKNLAALITDGTVVTVECEVGADLSSGSETFTGSGIVSSFSSNGDQGDVTTYDLTIQGNGALTIA